MKRPRPSGNAPRRAPRGRLIAPGRAKLLMLAVGGVCVAFGGCHPKRTVHEAGDAAKYYVAEAERLGKKTGEALGLIKPKPVDYVRLAYQERETPAALQAHYTLSEEREVGRALSAEIFGRFGRYKNAKLERYLARVAAALCAYSERPELPCCVGVLQSEEVRAFAAPGGYLLITLGALRTCASESELAGLLAGALARVELRHTLALLEKLQTQRLPESAGRPLTETSKREFQALIEKLADRLVQQGPSPAEQRACDRQATALLVRLGYEPGGLKAFLVRVRLKPGAPGKREPLQAREAAIEARLAELHAPSTGKALLSRYRRRCLAELPAPRLAP